MTWRASRSFSVPAATRADTRATSAGVIGSSDTSMPDVVRAPGQLAEPPLAGVSRGGAGRNGRLHGV